MGTRSVVATREGDGWKGRYVHWDGYPEGVGAAVANIVARDGRDKAIQTLLTDNPGWSSVDGEGGTVPDDDGRFRVVEGYGVAYTTDVIKGKEAYTPQGNMDEWLTHEDTNSWIEYVHIIEEDGTVTSMEL